MPRGLQVRTAFDVLSDPAKRKVSVISSSSPLYIPQTLQRFYP